MLPGVNEPKIPFAPPLYRCRKSKLSYPGKLNGRLDKPFWDQVAPIVDFQDIEGGANPLPAKQTEVRMTWDDENLYIGARLMEDQIWATVQERDQVIFVDNDFEVFLSPKHSTHRYYEIEMNAAYAVWDLMMLKPNRDLVNRIISWDIQGLETAVYIDGELNDPNADNKFWSLEIKIPWFSLRECEADECYPTHIVPDLGEVWRINFSRVEYDVEVKDGKYEKRKDPKSQTYLPEHNWVWAPTGAIDIHMPEMWGYLFFADAEDQVEFVLPANEKIAWELRKLYYRQRNYGVRFGKYTTDFAQLKENDVWTIDPQIDVTPSLFEISTATQSGRLHIREDGLIWATKTNDVF